MAAVAIERPSPLRIVLADDHVLIREGIKLLIESDEHMVVIDAVSDGEELVETLCRHETDLAIVDVVMPVMTGLQAARELRNRSNETPIMFLTSSTRESFLFEALELHARGYIHKSVAPEDFLDACRRALRGECVLCAGALDVLMRDWVARGSAHPEADPLTPREMRVLKLIAEGWTNQRIASHLVLSVKTVERHRANIMAKLDMHDRVDLCRFAIRSGLVEA